MKIKRRVILISMFLMACGGGIGDVAEDLSEEYFYYSEGKDLRLIESRNDRKRSILPTVIDYEFNEKFILAEQRPNYMLHRCEIASLFSSNLDIQERERQADSMLKNDQFYKRILNSPVNFWIIIVKGNVLIGPLTKEDYLAKRKELGIPSDLKLESE